MYSLNSPTVSLKLAVHGGGAEGKFEFAFILVIRNSEG